MVRRYRPERVPTLEPVLGQLPGLFGQVSQGQPKVVRVLQHRQEVARLLQADLLQARLSLNLLDVLEHAVQTRSGEVRLGVGEPGLIVRASRLAQRQESLAFQVRDQRRLLPSGAGLNEEPCQHLGQRYVFSDQRLAFF